MVPLYMARLSDLKPGDMVRAECPCGHDGLIEPAALTALGLRPYDRILDLAPRLRCGQCDRRGRAMVTVIWHGAASGRRS